jgi:VanZ family protein
LKIVKLWLPVIIWAGVIFWLSSIPNLKTGLEYDFLLRKIAHAAEYFILTFLLFRAFKGSFKMNNFQLYIYPTTLAFFYAASDEFHQSFVPSRSATVRDVLIDAVGILGFYVVVKAVKEIVKFKERNHR